MIVGSDPPTRTGILVGSIHDKWVDTLSLIALGNGGCTKYLLPPLTSRSSPPATDDRRLPEDLTISQLEPSDIPILKSASAIPHADEYYTSRCVMSVCIRTNIEGSPSLPVAWAFPHADGSIGGLYVQPQFRAKGLAQQVIEAAVDRLRMGEREEERGGALGWNWVDVMENNASGERLFERMAGAGWKAGWKCNWMMLKFP